MRIVRKISIFVLFAEFFLAGCGGGGSDGSFNLGFVEDVRVDPAAVRVEGDVTVTVDFEPNTTSDLDDAIEVQASDVAVLLPPGVDYVKDSSQLDGNIFDGFNSRPPNSVTICADGSRALYYRLAVGELSTLGDNKIKIKARPFEVRGGVSFTAEVDSIIFSPCEIVGQDSDTLLITK